MPIVSQACEIKLGILDKITLIFLIAFALPD